MDHNDSHPLVMPEVLRTGVSALPELRARWRSMSANEAWLNPHDWANQQVNDLIAAHVSGQDLYPAMERLGKARGEAGVGIDEALADLACFTAVVAYRGPTWSAARALARGWADGAAAPQPAVDPSSDLPTLSYFTVRLRELYQDAAAAGRSVPQTKALVVVDTAVECGAAELVLARSAGLGQVFTALFTDGRPVACLKQPAAVGVAVLERDASLPVWLARLRLRLRWQFASLAASGAVRLPPRIWVEALPPTHAGALDLLASLVR